MSDLRKQLIRLAHEKPELRPHILPILKKSRARTWIPETPGGWGFDTEGISADKAAKDMSVSLKKGLADLDRAVDQFKTTMRDALKRNRAHYSTVDPLAAIALVSSRRLKELSEEVDRYFYY